MAARLLRWLSIGLLLVSTGIVLAQDSTESSMDLSYNSPVNGAIDDANPIQEWLLATISADSITVLVERTDGNLIPAVVINDEAGTELATSYGATPTADTALIERFNLPAGGEYRVVVGRNGGADGVTSGAYTLTIIPEATAPDNINNMTVISEVEINTPIDGEITATHWSHRYTYNALAPDSIRVTAERASGTLRPEIEILDSGGISLRTGYISPEGNTATIDRQDFTVAGEFTIVVRRERGFDGATVGGYRLLVEMVGSGVGSPNLAGTVGEVEYDTPVTGTITPEQWYQDWSLTADAGDTIRFFVERNDPAETLQPEVILLGGSGQEIRRGYTNYDGATAEMDPRALDAPGEYIVRVSRAQGQTGLSSGSYTLTVELVGSGVGSPELGGTSGTVANGEPVTSEVTPARWADTWVYAGEADQEIVIIATRADGNLIPFLAIQDLNGQELRSAYPENSFDRAILRYRLPASNEYRIVVSRDRGQDGLTTGAFELSVAPASNE